MQTVGKAVAVPETNFRAQGFALLPRFLSQHEVEEARRLVEAHLAGPIDPSCVRPHNTLAPLRWKDELVRLVATSPERAARLAGATNAVDLRWISGYISVKEPRSAPLWWHQDWWCWEHPASFQPEAPQVALLCYLAPTDATSGALRVLPGSHRRSAPIHALLPAAHVASQHGIAEDHPVLQDLPGQISLPLQPGDAVVLDYRLLHGTHANHAPRRRDCLVLNFAPSWSTLPPDIQGHLIQHLALPTAAEPVHQADPMQPLLPRFQGTPRDLALQREAPPDFHIP